MNDIENVLDNAYCKCKYSTIDKGHEKLHRWKNWKQTHRLPQFLMYQYG